MGFASKFFLGVDLRGQRAVNIGDPSSPTDAANKQYVDAVARGLDWKSEVIAASTGNVNVASPGATLDGVALSAAMQTHPELGSVTRVLLKDNTAAAENGVWDWNGATSPLTRSVDSNTGALLSGSTYTVQRGSVNADRVYRINTDDSITVGTTAISFGQIGAAAAPYTGSTGLVLVGQDFRVNPTSGGGLLADGTGLRVDPTVRRRFGQDCAATTNPQTFTHNQGTVDIDVAVWAGGEKVYPSIYTLTATQVTIDWGSAPAASDYRVVAG